MTRAPWFLLPLSALLSVPGCKEGAAPKPQSQAPPAAAVQPSAVAADVAAVGSEAHGELRDVDGQRVLHVWGTPREMGHAHGSLLREEILDVIDGYALEVLGPATIDRVGMMFSVVDVSPRLREEAEGIVEGMKAAGGAHSEGLGRSLRPTDLLVLNAMTDLVAIGCSSVSAWGDAVADDPDGDPVVVRNLDWDDTPALLRNQMLVVYEPEEKTRQPVVSVAFAGYIGCLSCMNEAGVTALFNMGYGDGAASLATAATGFAPANLLLRDVLEQRDVNGDGSSTASDVEAAFEGARHAGSYLLHVLQPGPEAPARVIEVEADGVVVRGPDADGPLGGSMLAATNHLRGKAGAKACRRYDRIEATATKARHRVDEAALWSLGRRLRLDDVVHMMLVRPDERSLRVWLRAPGESSSSREAGVTHRWTDVLRVPSQP
ncbi:MAG: C45 family peptidase [Myxococcota bacterium]